ncbi:MAG: GHKL domain-containing protein [Oscillospiraceae bacterium]|nr:GHKL domain-containing protein [Oscillospiraceae bacterium]
MILQSVHVIIATLIVVISVSSAESCAFRQRNAWICFAAFIAAVALMRAYLQEAETDNVFAVLLICFPAVTAIITLKKTSYRRIIYLSYLVIGLVLLLAELAGWFVISATKGNTTMRLTDLFSSTALLLICLATAKNRKLGRLLGKLMAINAVLKGLLLVSVWISILHISLLSEIMLAYANPAEFILTGVLAAVLIMLMGVVFPLLVVSSLANESFRNTTMLLDKQVKAQTAYYEAMAKKNEDIRQFIHDYKNLNIRIKHSLNEHDIAGALTLLESDDLSLDSDVGRFNSGSSLLDALMYEKQLRASESETKILFSGYMDPDLLLAADICVIFGNAIDNAIEACEMQEADIDKVISVSVKSLGGILFIEITNPVSEDVEIHGKWVKTTKSDKAAHGIGLRSMNAAVEKYSGDMSLSCNDRIFRVNIDIDFNLLPERKP